MYKHLIKEIRQDVKKSLPDKRYQHTVGVAYTAASLAMRYGICIEDALIAGFLHDSAKYYNDDRMITECRGHDIEIRSIEERNPYLLHGKVGALIAREKYGITNDEILDAVRYHTTGKPNMKMLEKIIFIADYIEPGRKIIPGLEKVRQLAFLDLDKAVFKILERTIAYLKKETEKEMDCLTQETYEYYRKYLERRNK